VVNNQIIWEGTIEPDFGTQTEDQAANEVVITFSTTVAAGQNSARNQGLAFWDENNDGVIDANDANVANNAPVRTDDPTTAAQGDATIALPPGRGGGAGTGTGDGTDGQGGEAASAEDALGLPDTGFTPGEVTALEMPAEGLNYHHFEENQIRLRIPALGVDIPVVGVPYTNGKWNTDWLWEQAGYLEGTTFPTMDGHSVLTAHNYLPNGEAGPFVNLAQLQWNDQIIIHSDGKDYTYLVRHSAYVAPGDTSPLDYQDGNWVTLISCYLYDEEYGGYLWRVVVKAVLAETQ
jgi:LPXTG-site transpeptidase (sortase) family protein